MKLCNETITIYNKRLDAENGWYVYIPTVISGVSWYGEVASNVGDKGLNAANRYTIRIPIEALAEGKTYVDPVAYRDSEYVDDVFTIANGDVIVKGATEDEASSIDELHERFSDCCTVLGVTDNRRAPNAPHFRVVGS